MCERVYLCIPGYHLCICFSCFVQSVLVVKSLPVKFFPPLCCYLISPCLSHRHVPDGLVPSSVIKTLLFVQLVGVWPSLLTTRVLCLLFWIPFPVCQPVHPHSLQSNDFDFFVASESAFESDQCLMVCARKSKQLLRLMGIKQRQNGSQLRVGENKAGRYSQTLSMISILL